MSRQMVEQVQCDRCKRVELRPSSPEGTAKVEMFTARFGTDALVYPDLCTYCQSSIARLWKEMKEWERELKQGLLGGPAVPNNQAAPVQSAPNYTPPKPHHEKK